MLTNETSESVQLPEAREDLNGAPAGYDANAPFGGMSLKPAPPDVKTLSRKVGLIGILVVMFVVMLIIYGAYSRGQKNKAAVQAAKDDKSMVAATNTAKAVEETIENQREAAVAKKGSQPIGGVDSSMGDSMPVGGESAAPPLTVVPNRQNVPKLPERTNGIGGGGAPASPVLGVGVIHGLTAEERRREELYKMEMAAMVAPTAASGNAGGGVTQGSGSLVDRVSASVTNPITSLLSQLRPLAAQSAASAGLGPNTPNDDPNMQDRKEAFITKAETLTGKNYLQGARTKPSTRYEIKTGWDIPATLEQGINSDLPGQIKALVRENVYDTATGQYLLIPQGSRVIGSYDSHVAYGQSRVQIVWSYLVFPDGTTMNLEGMIGQDAQGAAGAHDKVNNHYVRLFGMALLTSAFSAGIQISQGSNNNSTGYPSNSQLATQALGQQMGQLGIEIARKNMAVQPTITVPIGYRFNVRVNRDVAFAEPYVSVAR